jgi:hypothetical protein
MELETLATETPAPPKWSPDEIEASLTSYLAKHPNPPHSAALWGWFFDAFPEKLAAYAETQKAIAARRSPQTQDGATSGPAESPRVEATDGAPTSKERAEGQSLDES